MKQELKNRLGYIYKIVSPNNKIYIGQTINVKHRKAQYKTLHFKRQKKLWNNCNFYDWNPLNTFEIIEECLCGDDKLFLNEREIYWISFYDSFNNGLNCNQGGNGNIGYIPSDETREKMRQKKIGIKHPEWRNKRKSERQQGHKLSKKTKDKISETKRKNMNDRTKEKIRIGLMGNKDGIANKGNTKKWTTEYRKNMMEKRNKK